MPSFISYDGTEIAYRRLGSGEPLIVAPGGPGRASEYLGDLGGLHTRRELIIFDNRGTGASQVPADPATYRVDHLVKDVDALREHLGLDTIDLLGHSAGGGIGLLYAAAHPDRLRKLILATPSLAAAGLDSHLDGATVIAERAHEPWYAEATAAHAAVVAAGSWEEGERHRYAMAPLIYGRWDAVAQAHAAADPSQRSKDGTLGMYKGLEVDAAALAAKYAVLPAPVLLIGGELDIWPTRFAAAEAIKLFRDGELVILPGAGHYPWLEAPEAFVAAADAFLSR